MDAIMDLTARAVSFITLIQDTYLRASVHTIGSQPIATSNEKENRNNRNVTHHFDHVFGSGFADEFSKKINIVKAQERAIKIKNGIDPDKELFTGGIESKIIELVWFSTKPPEKEERNAADLYAVELCTNLVNWITNNSVSIKHKVDETDAFASPYVWRDAISEIIYYNKAQRIDLAKKLEYLPLHLVLAMGGSNYEANEQRIFQWWQINKTTSKVILTEAERKLHKEFKVIVYHSLKENSDKVTDEVAESFYTERAEFFLSHYRDLTAQLLKVQAPLPFEYIFNSELDEIRETRKMREQELLPEDSETDESQTSYSTHDQKSEIIDTETITPAVKQWYSCDPFIRARDMKLFALCFSGGGIRSATFNLGILQGLAKQGVIGNVDYLSTVSGGGYIGSWLATWIKREGSVKKVTDRLNPLKSPDPLGEEVRPIRWLRMFSNYFTPNSSIMSVDSWTVGITWLRNTLLNQIVIFLIFLSGLLLFRSSFEIWLSSTIWRHPSANLAVYVTSCVILFIVAFLTGVGMQWYNRGQQTALSVTLNKYNIIAGAILTITLLGSYIGSASLYIQDKTRFIEKIIIVYPIGIVAFALLIMIAIYGRYDVCISTLGKSKARTYFIIFYTALFAAIVGCMGLIGAWSIMELVKKVNISSLGLPFSENDALAFTIGPPIISLAFGVTVVARMAFLGKYFPDERREWWGRMGAVINRTAFIWILVCSSTFLLRGVFNQLLSSWHAPASLGGWIVLVAGTVKTAFSSKTSGKTEAKGFQATSLDIISKAAPYLFALGILVFLPALIEPLIRKKFIPYYNIENHVSAKAAVLAVILFIPAAYLSWRLGVNEFSMHHFYRNRLVRAYLGATRRKSTRDKTSNPFTGFDRLDDEKLSKFTHDQGYFGPYPVLNIALNASQVSDMSRQDRKAESFIFSPLYCGFDFSKIRSSANVLSKSYDYAYRPTELYAYPKDKGPGIGTAMAISGAAVNPNQGYHSSSATAFLLTVFNVQMGWWMGNPRKRRWQQSDPNFGLAYILKNLAGQSNTRNKFVCLSDGGHFDNMGLYEMVRRRCSFIIVCDGEQDENFTCEGFANAIRKCRIDFGAEISIDITGIVKRENRFSKAHYATGDIKYSGDTEAKGVLLYIKSSITGDEPVDVKEYSSKNETFPHQTTADQFFDEEQFESYRKLGMHIADKVLSDQKVVKKLMLDDTVEVEESLMETIEKPVKNLFNTLKDFFAGKNKKDSDEHDDLKG